jgi:hypothetical protein
LRTLLAAYREKLMWCYDIAPDAAMRHAWMAESLPYGGGELRRDAVATPVQLAEQVDGAPLRVLLMGDTGDASQAQRAVAVQVRGRAHRRGAHLGTDGVAAILIESDIVYPAGAGSEYGVKFRRPYRELLKAGRPPIYAVPGNHDWDDGSLIGFMSAFCGVTELPDPVRKARIDARKSGVLSLAALVWRNGGTITGALAPSGTGARQPGPYFALDVGGALFIGVDTGYGAMIDIQQAEWLVQIVEANPEMPKVLFSGKPLIVNGRRAPCHFTPVPGDSQTEVSSAVPNLRYTSVDDIVRRPENGFVAVIGGDVHNYQRYVAHITAPNSHERVLPYLVCGGGGVFIGQTYWIEPVDIDEAQDAEPDTVRCLENETVFFPQRAHSRLFLQAIVRRSVTHPQFTLPIGLVAAGVLTIVLAILNAIARGAFHAPHGWAGVSLGLIAVAVNMSARPITWKGGFLSLGVGAVGALLIHVPDRPQGIGSVTAIDAERAMIGAVVVGLLLLVVGSVAPLWPWMRTALSLIGALAVLAASSAVVLLSVRRARLTDVLVAAIVLAGLATVAYVTELFRRNITVEKAFDEPRWLSRKLSKRQRLFSIYETFTDGRLNHRRRIKYLGETHTPKLPLYRSFLEIEHVRDKDGRWTFAFTAFGVTGEANTDTNPASNQAPRKIDAFEVNWKQGEPLQFVIAPPPGEQTSSP